MSTDYRPEPLFTHKVQGDKRSFFFNVKKAPTGDLYLTISQYAKVAEEWVRLKVVVTAEDAKPFYQGLCEAIKAMRQAEITPEPEGPVSEETTKPKTTKTKTTAKAPA